ncbi:MAG: hypothetical protein AAFV53_40370 [Myxococcota bacterium]
MPKKSAADKAEHSDSVKKLKAGCKKARKKPVSFFYCRSGPDGEPVLLVGPRIQADSKPIIARARVKKFIRGKLAYEDGAYVFKADRPGDSKFKKHLKEKFGKDHPPLKRAQVAPLQDADQEPTLKEELAAEIGRRKARKERNAIDQNTDPDGYWKARHQELKLDIGEKIDIVANAEQAIASRLESGSTERVRPRLERSLDRIRRLLRLARRALTEVRA